MTAWGKPTAPDARRGARSATGEAGTVVGRAGSVPVSLCGKGSSAGLLGVSSDRSLQEAVTRGGGGVGQAKGMSSV